MSSRIKYPSVDWSKLRNDEIASIVGAHPNTVLRHRAALGKPAAPRKVGSGKKERIRDAKIDLAKTARWNARKQKCNPHWMGVRMRKLRAKA